MSFIPFKVADDDDLDDDDDFDDEDENGEEGDDEETDDEDDVETWQVGACTPDSAKARPWLDFPH